MARLDVVTDGGLLGNQWTTSDRGVLADRMIAPPFSVFDTKQGWWQERKRAWVQLGIQSELGRDAVSYESQDKLTAFQKAKPGAACMPSINQTFGRASDAGTTPSVTGVSIFDPVLCELMMLWYVPDSGIVLDPFAGGSVRGVVAAAMQKKYWGCELRAEQVDANIEQARNIGPSVLKYQPRWVTGDSGVIVPAKAPQADFLWSCPPYGNLEVYSDDPADISNRTDVGAFARDYYRIISCACDRLRDNRFAAFVVGNYRDGNGHMVDLVGMTIKAFEAAGLKFYNDAVILNPPGTAPIRTNTNFHRGHRKLVKIHQNLLIFLKGDAKLAATDLPALSVA